VVNFGNVEYATTNSLTIKNAANAMVLPVSSTASDTSSTIQFNFKPRRVMVPFALEAFSSGLSNAIHFGWQ